jgi:hypothetical protein
MTQWRLLAMVSILSLHLSVPRVNSFTGSQGYGQGLNMRDQGLNVIVGVRKNGQSWREAEQDGWIPGNNLFEIDEAISRGTIVMNLLSDAAQSETWPAIKPQLIKGKVCSTNSEANSYTYTYRLFTSLTAFLQFSRTLQRSMSPPTLMLSLSPPRALAELSEACSVRAVV